MLEAIYTIFSSQSLSVYQLKSAVEAIGCSSSLRCGSTTKSLKAFLASSEGFLHFHSSVKLVGRSSSTSMTCFPSVGRNLKPKTCKDVKLIIIISPENKCHRNIPWPDPPATTMRFSTSGTQSMTKSRSIAKESQQSFAINILQPFNSGRWAAIKSLTVSTTILGTLVLLLLLHGTGHDIVWELSDAEGASEIGFVHLLDRKRNLSVP